MVCKRGSQKWGGGCLLQIPPPASQIPEWGHLAWREGPGRAGRLLARPKVAQKEVGEEAGGKMKGETFAI